MSFPIKASQLRLLKEKEKNRRSEEIIVANIENISKEVLFAATHSRDSFIEEDHGYLFSQYEIDKIVKGLKLNFPDCLVKYIAKPEEGIRHRFIVDWRDSSI